MRRILEQARKELIQVIRDKRAMLQVVAVTLFGQQGKELTVTGDEGTLNTETKNFVLANRSAS